jgi:signal transduction histidine kinase
MPRQRKMLKKKNAVGEERTGFIAQVAHDLRTPLTTVKGYSELVAATNDQTTIVKNLATEAQRVVVEVDALLDLLMLENHEIEFMWEECELASSISLALKKFHSLNGNRTIVLEDTKKSPRIICDKKRLIASFVLLFLWLDKKLPKSVVVSISLSSSDRECICSISVDSGNLPLEKGSLSASENDLLWRFPLFMLAAHKATLRRHRAVQTSVVLTILFLSSNI